MATAQIMYAPPPQSGVVISSVGNQDSRKEKHKMKLRSLGIVEVVLGSLSCLLCLITIFLAVGSGYYHRYHMTHVSSGIWCGMFAIISGSLGICARKKPTTCMYNANLAMSIVASVFMGTQIVISSITAVMTAWGPLYRSSSRSTIIAFHSLLAVNGFATLVICIVHSAYCCAGVCCRKNHLPPTQVAYTVAPLSQQYIQLPNGQYSLVMNQPQNYVSPMPGGTFIPGYVVAPQQQGGPVVAPTVAPAQYMNVTSGQGLVSVPQQQAIGANGVTGTPGPLETKSLDPNPPFYSA